MYFCHNWKVKDVKRMKRQATHWKKGVAKGVPDKERLSKIDKELLKLDNETINLIKNDPNTLTHTSLKKIYRW